MSAWLEEPTREEVGLAKLKVEEKSTRDEIVAQELGLESTREAAGANTQKPKQPLSKEKGLELKAEEK